MASYILRKIDVELWRRVKSKAALEPITIKALIERLLRAWVDPAEPTRDALENIHGIRYRNWTDDELKNAGLKR